MADTTSPQARLGLGGGLTRRRASAGVTPLTLNTANSPAGGIAAPPVVLRRFGGRSPFPRRHFASFAHLEGNAIVIFGGADLDGNLLGDVVQLIPGGVGVWGSVTSIGVMRPPPRTGATAVFSPLLSRMYVFGGYVAGAADNNVYALDFGRGKSSWSKPRVTGAAPSPRQRHAASLVGDRMFVFGGQWNGTALDDMHVFDVAQCSWQSVSAEPGAAWPSARSGHSLVAVGTNLYLFGGVGENGEPLGDHWLFNTEEGGWQQLTAPTSEGPSARHSHIAVAFNGDLFLLGGTDAHTDELTDLFYYATKSDTWLRVCDVSFSQPSKGSFAAHVLKNRIYILGGRQGEVAIVDPLRALPSTVLPPAAVPASPLARRGSAADAAPPSPLAAAATSSSTWSTEAALLEEARRLRQRLANLDAGGSLSAPGTPTTPSQSSPKESDAAVAVGGGAERGEVVKLRAEVYELRAKLASAAQPSDRPLRSSPRQSERAHRRTLSSSSVEEVERLRKENAELRASVKKAAEEAHKEADAAEGKQAEREAADELAEQLAAAERKNADLTAQIGRLHEALAAAERAADDHKSRATVLEQRSQAIAARKDAAHAKELKAATDRADAAESALAASAAEAAASAAALAALMATADALAAALADALAALPDITPDTAPDSAPDSEALLSALSAERTARRAADERARRLSAALAAAEERLEAQLSAAASERAALSEAALAAKALAEERHEALKRTSARAAEAEHSAEAAAEMARQLRSQNTFLENDRAKLMHQLTAAQPQPQRADEPLPPSSEAAQQELTGLREALVAAQRKARQSAMQLKRAEEEIVELKTSLVAAREQVSLDAVQIAALARVVVGKDKADQASR